MRSTANNEWRSRTLNHFSLLLLAENPFFFRDAEEWLQFSNLALKLSYVALLLRELLSNKGDYLHCLNHSFVKIARLKLLLVNSKNLKKTGLRKYVIYQPQSWLLIMMIQAHSMLELWLIVVQYFVVEVESLSEFFLEFDILFTEAIVFFLDANMVLNFLVWVLMPNELIILLVKQLVILL